MLLDDMLSGHLSKPVGDPLKAHGTHSVLDKGMLAVPNEWHPFHRHP